MNQRLREVDREMKYEEYSGREGDIVTGIIQQGDSRYTLLELNRGVEALLPQAEQVPHERPQANSRLKAYIVEVRKTAKGPQIVVSRTHPGLIRRLFEMEVPEIAEGIVELKACAREPGHRTKIAVWSNDANVDPVGACVGARGARVRMVVNELNGEKIDIVPFTEIPEDLVAKALAPAKVKEVRLDYETGTATVIVPDFQLSLAIGKEGQNARLAARLSGWRVDIKSETQLVEEEAYADQDWAEGEWVTNDAGEQVWQPADGSEALSAEAWAEATEQNEAKAEGAEDEDEAEGPATARPPTAAPPRARPPSASTPRPPATSRPCPRRSAAAADVAGPARPRARRPRRHPRGRDRLRRRGRHEGGTEEASGGRAGPWPSGPSRTCIGCRAVPRPDDLVRVVRTADGGLHVGRDRTRAGRLAVPPTRTASAEARRRRAFAKALRGAGPADAIDGLGVAIGA